MRYTYSPINDIYGTESALPQPRREKSAWPVILLALAAIFLYESVHPVTRLRSDPPPEFVKAPANPRASLAAGQENTARAYWNLAAESVSERYSYGDTLPKTPPRDFTLASGADYGTSAVYWQRLRELWNQQTIWVTSYQLNTNWIPELLDSSRDFARNYLDITF
jgi:hypothetical protein